MNELSYERALTLLRATRDLLDKQNHTRYVLNMLDELVYYDDAECDGACLLDDINIFLENEA